jgi:hypothetical protein
MYEIELMDGEIMWMNERIIKTIHRSEDGYLILTKFNPDLSGMKIKSFKKL